MPPYPVNKKTPPTPTTSDESNIHYSQLFIEVMKDSISYVEIAVEALKNAHSAWVDQGFDPSDPYPMSLRQAYQVMGKKVEDTKEQIAQVEKQYKGTSTITYPQYPPNPISPRAPHYRFE